MSIALVGPLDLNANNKLIISDLALKLRLWSQLRIAIFTNLLNGGRLGGLSHRIIVDVSCATESEAFTDFEHVFEFCFDLDRLGM